MLRNAQEERPQKANGALRAGGGGGESNDGQYAGRSTGGVQPAADAVGGHEGGEWEGPTEREARGGRQHSNWLPLSK